MSKRKTPAPMEKHEQWGKTLYAIRELLFNEDALPNFFDHYRKDSRVYRTKYELIKMIDDLRTELLEDLYRHHSHREGEYTDDDHFFHIYYRQYHKRNGERNLEVTCGDCREKRLIDLVNVFDEDEEQRAW